MNIVFPEAEPEDYRQLVLLREEVKRYWVSGVLENSLHGAALLDLGLETREEAVEHRRSGTLEFPDRAEQALPPGTEMIDVFEEAGRALLILGAPGSGKTVSLLELARDLIARSEDDPRQPVPVVLNLSTWTPAHLSLDAWLAEEMKTLYYVPEKLSRTWLRAHRLLLLLDGLDEVLPEYRAGCVKAINAFTEEHGLPGLVVCSRHDEYTRLDARLRLRGAVRLRPLTFRQVDAYLAQTGPRLAPLRGALQSDPALQTLAQTPLMLSVMSLAYQDTSVEALRSNRLATPEARRNHLFETYIRRMFVRKGRDHPYAARQTRAWLSWLARQMSAHRQTVFLIEQLQPSWLATRWQRWTYLLASRLVGGLALGLILALMIGLTAAQSEGWISDAVDLFAVAAFGLTLGGAGGLVAGLLDAVHFKKETPSSDHPPRTRGQGTVAVVLYVLISGLLGGLVVSLADRSEFLIHGVFFGLIWGRLLGLILGTGQSTRSDIRTVETLKWSWAEARRKSVRGILVGAPLGAALGLLSSFIQGTESVLVDLLAMVIAGFSGGLIGGLIGALFGGLSRGLIETKSVPNQGIRLSIRNAAYGGLVVGLAATLIVGLPLGLIQGLGQGAAGGLTTGLFFGLLAGLWYGGFEVIQHYTLRLLLYRSGCTPRRYARFLDHAARLIFLQKVGGGYTFIHRFLLEHFAERDEVDEVDEHTPAREAMSRSEPPGVYAT